MLYSSFRILYESLMGNEILTWSFQYVLLPECHNIDIRNQLHIFYFDININAHRRPLAVGCNPQI